tara:strand:- start:17427 stop:18899 length:1473 start_codon:yes stop_codon:yes gene_type:complete
MSNSGGLVQLINDSNTDEFLAKKDDYDELFKNYEKTNKMAKTIKKIDFQTAPILYSQNSATNIFTSNNLNDNSEDLLTNTYFCCELPEIYSDRTLKFKWIKNIGLSIIKEVELKIGDVTMQKLTADWLNIWYDLSIDKTKFDNIIGNSSKLNNPVVFNNKKVIIKNNKLDFRFYPNSSQENNIPSIKKTKLIIPLNFWFSKELKTALPIAFFNRTTIKISITLKDAEDLYTLYSNELEQDISPSLYNELYNTNYTIKDFLKEELKNNVININAYIQKQGFLLGTDELSYLISIGRKDYIFDDVQILEKSLLLNTNIQTIDLGTISKPIKEIIWILRREDSSRNFNNHINFTGSYNTNSEYDILNNATYKVANEHKIFEELDSSYLSYIPCLNNHTKIPIIPNIYVYSFAKNPEGPDSTGHFNATNMNNKISLKLNTFNLDDENYNFNLKLNKLFKFKEIDKSLSEYKIKIFVVCYNFISISINDAKLRLI